MNNHQHNHPQNRYHQAPSQPPPTSNNILHIAFIPSTVAEIDLHIHLKSIIILHASHHSYSPLACLVSPEPSVTLSYTLYHVHTWHPHTHGIWASAHPSCLVMAALDYQKALINLTLGFKFLLLLCTS